MIAGRWAMTTAPALTAASVPMVMAVTAPEVEPRNGDRVGRRVEDTGEDLDQHHRENGSGYAPATIPTTVNTPVSLKIMRPQVSGRWRPSAVAMAIGAASFGQPEGKHEPARADGEDQREAELDAGESGEVHRGEA